MCVYCLLTKDCLLAIIAPPENNEEPTAAQSKTNTPRCVAIKQNVWEYQIMCNYITQVWFLVEYVSPWTCGLGIVTLKLTIMDCTWYEMVCIEQLIDNNA